MFKEEEEKHLYVCMGKHHLIANNSLQLAVILNEDLGYTLCTWGRKYTGLTRDWNKALRKPVGTVQFSSVTQSCPTLCDPVVCSMPGLPVHHQLPEFTQTHVHWVSDAIQPSHPLSSPSPLEFNLPSIRVFFSGSALRIKWPKYWSFSFNASPSNEYSGLISFTMDWLDLLVVQGTLKSFLQHHSSKGSVLRCSTFFIV